MYNLPIGAITYCPDPLLAPRISRLVEDQNILHLPVVSGIPPKYNLLNYLRAVGYRPDEPILITTHLSECHGIKVMDIAGKKAIDLGFQLVDWLDAQGFCAIYHDFNPRNYVPPYYKAGTRHEGKLQEICAALQVEAFSSQVKAGQNLIDEVVVTGLRNKPAEYGQFIINAPLHDERGYPALASAIQARGVRGDTRPILQIDATVCENRQHFWHKLLTQTYPVCIPAQSRH